VRTLLCMPKPSWARRQVSEASAAWLVHWVLLKGVLWALGVPGAVPFLELAAYVGYAFVPVCISMLAGLALGAPPRRCRPRSWSPRCPARGNIKYVHDKK